MTPATRPRPLPPGVPVLQKRPVTARQCCYRCRRLLVESKWPGVYTVRETVVCGECARLSRPAGVAR